MKDRKLFLIILLTLAIIIYIIIARTELPLSPNDHCNTLSGVSKDYCVIFNEIDARIDNGNGFIGVNNEQGKIAWTRSYILRGYVEMYSITKDTYYLDKLTAQIDDIWQQRDDVRGFRDYKGQSKPGWSSIRHTETNDGLRFVVHSGVILFPITEFIKIVYDESSLHSAYKSKADSYLIKTEEVVATHEAQWRTGPDPRALSSEGYYKFPSDSPVLHPGFSVPHNQQLAMGSTLITLYDITSNPEYKDKAERMGRMLQHDLDTQSGTYIWHYWGSNRPPGGTAGTKFEDMGHGSIDTQFAQIMYEHGLLFDNSDMDRFTKTFTKNIYRNSYTETAFRVDGTDPVSTHLSSTARWADFTQFNQNVIEIVDEIYSKNNFYNSANPVKLLGYAKLTKWTATHNIQGNPEPNLKAFYKLDSEANDYSGNNLHGSPKGNPSFVTGKKEGAVKLDGTDDYISLGNSGSLNPLNQITISAWIKPSSDKNSPVVERYTPTTGKKAYYLRKIDSDIIQFVIHNSQDTSVTATTNSNSFNTNEWTHVAGTYNKDSRIKVYINGIERDSKSAIGSIKQTSEETTIGGSINSNSRYFDGRIDEVKIYDRALSDEEILFLYDPEAIPQNNQNETNITQTPQNRTNQTQNFPPEQNFTQNSTENLPPHQNTTQTDYRGDYASGDDESEIITENEENQNEPYTLNESEECDGCIFEDVCIPFLSKYNEYYCTRLKKIYVEKTIGSSCYHDIECSTNYCKDSECKKEGFFAKIWRKIIEFFRKL